MGIETRLTGQCLRANAIGNDIAVGRHIASLRLQPRNATFFLIQAHDRRVIEKFNFLRSLVQYPFEFTTQRQAIAGVFTTGENAAGNPRSNAAQCWLQFQATLAIQRDLRRTQRCLIVHLFSGDSIRTGILIHQQLSGTAEIKRQHFICNQLVHHLPAIQTQR